MNQRRDGTIHRILAVRLLITALVIAVLVSLLVVFTARERVSEIAVDRAMQGAMTISVLTADILDEPGLPRRSELQARLDRFTGYTPNYTSGRYSFVLVKSPDGTGIARLTGPGLASEKAMAAVAAAGLPAPVNPDDVAHQLTEIDGKHHVVIAVPLVTSQNRVAAHIDAIFTVSDQAIRKVDAGLIRAVAISVGIVALTALLLYPTILQLLRRVTNMSGRLLDANLETIQLLGSAIAKRDSDTDVHNYRVTLYAVRLAEKLGEAPDRIRSLIKGAFLHDVGKLGIRDNILLKPGRLDENEFEEMKTHVKHGLDIVSRSDWLSEAEEVVGYHHQKYDGGGYYGDLKGKEIPLNARIFAIVDVFDALTSKRPYKDPLGFDKTMEILQEGSGSHFDPDVLEEFGEIARTLYDEFGQGDDEYARQALEATIDKYFRQDTALLMG
ncbi:MAG: HD domain-containing protein [Pseudomonadota bacterium]|nr:HD domain-containing protein [Pseudomonadota bacterium]